MALLQLTLFAAATLLVPVVQALNNDYPTANLSTIWTTTPYQSDFNYSDGSAVSPFLRRSIPGYEGLYFAAGFYCISPCNTFFFAIYIVSAHTSRINFTWSITPQFIWSANRGRAVLQKATIHFTSNGDLQLQDANGSLIWSTNTSGQSVAVMTLSESGNLMLLDNKNISVWQSFDHPTDCLLQAQPLVEGMRLTPNVSPTNWSASELYYLTIHADGLYAFVKSSPPQLYYQNTVPETKSRNGLTYATILNGSLAIFPQSFPPEQRDNRTNLPAFKSFQYLSFEFDGHLRILYTTMGQQYRTYSKGN